jgi:kelch-like protein 20
VYDAVVNWVKYDPERRKNQLPRLLQHIRLPLLSAKFITDVLDEEVRALLPFLLVKLKKDK